MYVETDFLVALVNEEDWLRGSVLRALDEYDVHTSILAYAEVLVLFYDHEAAEYEIDAPRAVTNLLELVPIRPAAHEDAVLAATVFIDEYDLTPFDALHAGVAATADEVVLSSEKAYDTVGLDRQPLEPEESG
ncbi:PIN domain-containing protein [Haloplanus aerogenes]|uniref:PIN domain-containing protein n=1 Tax=Haloplanus aerogenes TaxID=660522 RepID=A0A3M0DRH3_9EURY|nr:PIN domain-containing protein [Haloplanus aerogenes]AZH24245.1 PIN domain-containing protein [Haloplanus aerogenes]RMB24127.1 PIN domain-containing protein [Haloplanus aerogenes]